MSGDHAEGQQGGPFLRGDRGQEAGEELGDRRGDEPGPIPGGPGEVGVEAVAHGTTLPPGTRRGRIEKTRVGQFADQRRAAASAARSPTCGIGGMIRPRDGSSPRIRSGSRTGDWTRMQRLLLVIDVLSPSTSRADRFAKRRVYQEQRVPLYWSIDGDARTAEVWTPAVDFPLVKRERLVRHPEEAADPFTVELAELFRPL